MEVVPFHYSLPAYTSSLISSSPQIWSFSRHGFSGRDSDSIIFIILVNLMANFTSSQLKLGNKFCRNKIYFTHIQLLPKDTNSKTLSYLSDHQSPWSPCLLLSIFKNYLSVLPQTQKKKSHLKNFQGKLHTKQ